MDIYKNDLFRKEIDRLHMNVSEVVYSELSPDWHYGNKRPSFTRIYAIMEGEGVITYSDKEIAFTVIRHLVSALPSALLLAVILRAVALMDLVRCGDESFLPAAERLSRLCRTTVTVTVLSVAAVNLLQLFLFDRLLHVHISVVLPMMELIFVLGILLLTRYMAENRRLQEDNDLFI